MRYLTRLALRECECSKAVLLQFLSCKCNVKTGYAVIFRGRSIPNLALSFVHGLARSCARSERAAHSFIIFTFDIVLFLPRTIMSSKKGSKKGQGLGLGEDSDGDVAMVRNVSVPWHTTQYTHRRRETAPARKQRTAGKQRAAKKVQHTGIQSVPASLRLHLVLVLRGRAGLAVHLRLRSPPLLRLHSFPPLDRRALPVLTCSAA